MPHHSFADWLDQRPQEAPGTDRLATLIAQAGAAGVSLDRLRRLLNIHPETLADVLRGLVATGQVEMVSVGGRLRYRAAKDRAMGACCHCEIVTVWRASAADYPPQCGGC